MSTVSSLWATTSPRDDAGASAVEYGLLVALIAGVIVLAVIGLGIVVHGGFTDTCEELKKPGAMTTSANCN